MNCSTLGFPVLHCLPEFAQTHIPWILWYHPTISSSVVLFSCSPAFPASRSSPFSRLFASGGQSIGASAADLAVNVQGWSPLGLTSLISLPSNGLSRVFPSTSSEKIQLFSVQPSLWSQLSHPCMTTGRTRYLSIQTFVSKVVALPFNMLYRVAIPFLPRSSSVQSLSCVRVCDPMACRMSGLPIHHRFLEFTQTLVHWVGDAIHPSHPLSSPPPPALNLSQHQALFKWVSFWHQVAKYWTFSFNISLSNGHPGLISFRMNWLDGLEVQGTLKTLLH